MAYHLFERIRRGKGIEWVSPRSNVVGDLDYWLRELARNYHVEVKIVATTTEFIVFRNGENKKMNDDFLQKAIAFAERLLMERRKHLAEIECIDVYLRLIRRFVGTVDLEKEDKKAGLKNPIKWVECE